MDNFTLQRALAGRGLYRAKIDGDLGRQSRRAIDNLIEQVDPLGWDNWTDARRQLAAEQIVYRDLGFYSGAIDGLVGELTRYARERYSAKLRGDRTVETWRDETPPPVEAAPPVATRWPTQSEREMTKFFGDRGEAQVTLEMPFPLRIAWDPADTVHRVSCNAKVEAPLRRIWTGVLSHYGYERLRELRLDMFGGCLNVRLMRGSSSQWSIHSWGCAWDVDPDRNQLRWKRALASLDAPEYDKFWQLVEAEGAVSLGRSSDFDWMHFQFARLR